MFASRFENCLGLKSKNDGQIAYMQWQSRQNFRLKDGHFVLETRLFVLLGCWVVSKMIIDEAFYCNRLIQDTFGQIIMQIVRSVCCSSRKALFALVLTACQCTMRTVCTLHFLSSFSSGLSYSHTFKQLQGEGTAS